MGIYDFNFSSPPASADQQYTQNLNHGVRPENMPNIGEKLKVVGDEDINYSPESVRQVTTKGLYVLDEGIKNWLSGIKVQVKDTYKMASVHFVTQDRPILAWAQEFFNGRVSLPIISLKRTSWNFDQSHYFRPPYQPFYKQFLDGGKRVRIIYMPLPIKVEYGVSIWSAFKQDAEFIQLDIIKRCSPLGEIEIQDEYLQQLARISHTGVADSSDIDLGAKERPKIVYDINLSVEYAIPVNEKIAPTILGKVVSLKERDTKEVFEVYRVGDLV